MSESNRDPDLILSQLKMEEFQNKRGRLKVFFGAVAGVGKTYAMLETTRKLKEQNIDVVVGYVETHHRPETDALLEGLEILPAKIVEYRGTQLRELDLDQALTRNPEVIIVDELAHTNAPGSRNNKRWQDVQELLEAGIDVYTTMNVQHVETLHDVVEQITRISIRERVPDSLLERAYEIELIDLPPEELLERLKEGKVYVAEKAKTAIQHFFRKGNLIALRELALRYTAERVVAQMDEYRQTHNIKHPWPAAERILVCVSPSPLASRLVRAGKRMADALRAQWSVLYVEGQRQIPLPLADKNRVIHTLRLAEQLGAETLELSGANVPVEIIKCARQYNASKIVIGKPARARWKELLFGSVVDDVIRLSGSIDVYVISGDEENASNGHIKRPIRTSKTSDYVWVVATVTASTAVAKFMLPYFQPANIIMIYLLGVVLIASRCGKGPSILASLLSVAAFDFFYVPPYLTFAVSDTEYVLTFIVMLVVALIISTLTVTTRQLAESARLRETRTASLYSMSRELSSTLDISSLAAIGLRHVGEVFKSEVALLIAQPDDQLVRMATGQGSHELQGADSGIAAWVHRNRQPAGLSTDTLPGADALYLPLLGARKSIGVLIIRPSKAGTLAAPEQLHLLETFTNQMAAVCERAQISEESEQARLQIKTEQLKNSLLSSVSHDLRTPLATIAGAASGIIEGTESLDVHSCKEMAKEIYEEALRLNRLVGNLLDMTKLQSGTLQLARQLHPVDELIGAALSYVHDKTQGHTIKTSVPEDLPLVSVDAILIQQLLLNLIENATKYTPAGSEIEIGATADKDTITISVSDRGPGIRDELKKKIFEKFYREDASAAPGVGLGLAICRSILEAHEGKIWVEDRPGGGASFKFTLASAGEMPTIHADDDDDAMDAGAGNG